MASIPLIAALLAALFLAAVAALIASFLRRRTIEASADTEKGAEVEDASAVQRYAWREIESMTEGFTTAVIGEGGFSTVYLARLPKDEAFGAVKVHRESARRHRAFEQELEVLRRVRHHRIVRLLGYCDQKDEGALVFEYIPNGTLHDKLHSSPMLSWSRRLSIAYEIAQALEHLHEGCDLPVIHGDIKPTNILLDDSLHAKLCDFGSAKLGFSSTVRRAPVVGSPGYIDPHYLRTGVASKKSDVYSFGVVLLEMITGREAFCEGGGGLLTAAVGEALAVEGRLGEVVDGRMQGEYVEEEAAAVATLVRRCVGEGVRPTMREVTKVLAGIVGMETEDVGRNMKSGGG